MSEPEIPPLAAEQALGAVVARLGAEIAAPLTAALDRVRFMASSGRIGRADLLALRDEIDLARQAGMRGQQIARITNGQIHPMPERLRLDTLLRQVLDEQVAQSAGVGSHPDLAAVTVLADPSLLGTVLRAAADWSLSQARASISWRLWVQDWPVQACLVCHFVHLPPDVATPPAGLPAGLPADGAHHMPALDTLDWLLLTFSARLSGVHLQRDDSPSDCTLTLRFPHTVTETLEDNGDSPQPALRLPPGSQVLVLAGRREARQRVREALQGHDLFIDHVASVAEATQYCADGPPQMLLFESAFDGDALRALVDRMAPPSGALVLVEITPAGRQVGVGQLGERPVTELGAEALRDELARVLAHALAQAGAAPG